MTANFFGSHELGPKDHLCVFLLRDSRLHDLRRDFSHAAWGAIVVDRKHHGPE
jgi:hypothetical protein